MIRNNDEFKAEILRRKKVYLKKRNARIGVVTSSGVAILCLLLLVFPTFYKNPQPPNDYNSENHYVGSSDIVDRIVIYLSDRTVVEQEEVILMLNALEKYVPLTGEDLFHGSEVIPPGDDGDSDDFLSNAPPPSSGETSVNRIPLTFTVVSGTISKTYCLKDNSILVDGETYSMTEAEFNELYSLFGGEN